MTSSLYALILAGGSGKKLWPLSKELHPKHAEKVEENYSLFQNIFVNLVNCVDDKNIITMTGVKNLSDIKQQLNELQKKFCRKNDYTTVTEPQKKGTAPAIALGIQYIEKIQQDFLGNFIDCNPIIIVMPADCLIYDGETFGKSLEEAIKLAQSDYIVTFGVKPQSPDTSFGYIKIKKNKKIREISETALKVESFIEKPDEEMSKEFVNSDKFYWNTGIYVFKSSVLMNEIKKFEPEIYEIIKKAAIKNTTPAISLADYEKLPKISIEKSVISSTKKLAMLELNSDWKDVGSWKGIFEISEKDENGNYKKGNVIDLDSKNSVIYSSSKLVTTIGLEDTVVVETNDALLVCAMDDTSNIETLISENKNANYFESTVYRPWGYYTVLTEGKGFLTKCIYVNPGAKLSVQMHNHRAEHWIVIEGKAKVLKGEKFYDLQNGDSIDIELKEKHSLQNPYDEPLKIIEIQHGKVLDENDIIRFEDMYGRV